MDRPVTRQVVARPPAVWARPRAWLGRHTLVSDTALAVVLAATAVPPVSAIVGRDRPLAVALIIALACPLIWRRRAPAAVLAVLLALAVIQLWVNPGEGNDLLPLAVAFYTVATREPRWRVLAAAAALEAGAAVVPHAWVLYSFLIAFTLLLGYYVRTRRAAERARIAREVHDIVAHNIAVMTALADGAAYTAEASPGQGAALMRQVSRTGRSALAEMRRLIDVLREPPEHSPQPALDDIDELLATVRAAGLPVTMAVTGQPSPLPATARLTIYRIIQEALTNTLKHAPGATARIQLCYQPGQVDLEITDTGRPVAAPDDAGPGTGPAAAMPGTVPGGGHGIAGMRERAALFAGHVTAGPARGGGWRIHATLRPGPGPGEDEPARATEGTRAAAEPGSATPPATIGETGPLSTAKGTGPRTVAERA
jgi:signal transduction histidine kinase